MKIAIECLHAGADIGNRLREDGWTVESLDHLLFVEHPSVSTESQARILLHRLGLLTSGRVRIHFHPPLSVVEA